MSIIKVKGKALIKVRIQQGFNLRSLGEQCGVSYSSISKIENSKQCPCPRIAKKICDVLNISFDDLFEIIDNKRGA